MFFRRQITFCNDAIRYFVFLVQLKQTGFTLQAIDI